LLFLPDCEPSQARAVRSGVSACGRVRGSDGGRRLDATIAPSAVPARRHAPSGSCLPGRRHRTCLGACLPCLGAPCLHFPAYALECLTNIGSLASHILESRIEYRLHSKSPHDLEAGLPLPRPPAHPTPPALLVLPSSIIG
jgi:hypothetical protein